MTNPQPVGTLSEPGAIWLYRQLVEARLAATDDPVEFLRSTYRCSPGLAKRAGHLHRHVSEGYASVLLAWCHVATPKSREEVDVFAKRLPEATEDDRRHAWLAFHALRLADWRESTPPIMNTDTTYESSIHARRPQGLDPEAGMTPRSR